MLLFVSFFIFLEINPGCVDITCQNGGLCLYVNETHTAVCICPSSYTGQLCEGIIIMYYLIEPSFYGLFIWQLPPWKGYTIDTYIQSSHNLNEAQFFWIIRKHEDSSFKFNIIAVQICLHCTVCIHLIVQVIKRPLFLSCLNIVSQPVFKVTNILKAMCFFMLKSIAHTGVNL